MMAILLDYSVFPPDLLNRIIETSQLHPLRRRLLKCAVVIQQHALQSVMQAKAIIIVTVCLGTAGVCKLLAIKVKCSQICFFNSCISFLECVNFLVVSWSARCQLSVFWSCSNTGLFLDPVWDTGNYISQAPLPFGVRGET